MHKFDRVDIFGSKEFFCLVTYALILKNFKMIVSIKIIYLRDWLLFDIRMNKMKNVSLSGVGLQQMLNKRGR